MWNKAKCILLKTKENSGLLLGLSKFGRLISYDTECTNPNNDIYSVKQHLYIINDDVIKEGEICFHSNINEICVADEFMVENPDCKKVIATTDKSLVALFGNDEEGYRKQKEGLPQIPQSFIEQYITEYNKGNIINEVLVEYIQSADSFYGLDVPIELKINQDNTINIKTVKDSFSKEEVEVLLFNLAEHYGMTSTKSEIDDFNIWISENL